jgi:cytochrome c553
MTNRLSVTLVLMLALSACANPSTQQPAVTVPNGEIQNAAVQGGTTFPLEVLGAEGYTVVASIAVPKGSTAKRLWLQINNLSYDDKASVKLNAGAWIKLRNDSTVIEAAGKAYGGIGGGYSTLRLSVPISGAVDGANTLSFRFNQSDGISLGYRVLDLNFLDANAKKLIAANTLKHTDPNTWTPIRNTAQDIAKGKTLWSNATLKASYKTGASSIRAHCSECHSQDGRDLHQFNYSSYSIIERSKFHGLSQLEGEQIASYIRNLRQTLGTPSERCRPWNPPYQPGPGLDASKDWTCGAGLEAVLENDQDSLKSIFPTGYSKAAIAATGRLNAREIPVAFQLPDWKHWLPRVHPKDAWGDYFVNSNLNKRYAGEGMGSETVVLRDRLKTKGEAYILGKNGDFSEDAYYWGVELGERWNPATPIDRTRLEDQNKIYSTAQWLLIKNWELAQEFNLEQRCPKAYALRIASNPSLNANKIEPRSWCGRWRFVFDVSPHILKIPMDKNIFGGIKASTYFANAWYYLQLLINPGSGDHNVHLPTDWQYAYGLLKDLEEASGRTEPARGLVYTVKGMQEMANGIGVNNVDRGWNFRDAIPLDVWSDGKNGRWQGIPDATRIAAVNAYLETWLDKSEPYPEAAWQRIDGAGGDNWCGWSQRRLCWKDYQPGTLRGVNPTVENFPTWSYDAIPKMRADGINGVLLNRYAALMHKLYPNAGFAALKR